MSIDYAAFRNCTSLANITIMEGSILETIGQDAFSGCTRLTAITIPNNVSTIGQGAFSNCTGLTSVTFVQWWGIDSIGTNAFPEGSNGYGGNNLKTAYESGHAGTYTRDAGGSVWTKQ